MVKTKFDYIVVVDLEATCWDDDIARVSEITEFGIATYVIKTEEARREGSIYVQNRRTEISDYCVELTGITQKILDEKGLPFEGAVNKIVQGYGTRTRAWASWGDYDRIKVRQECILMNVKYPFSVRHINLKELFAIKYKLKKGCGMAKALEFCGLDLLGKHHCGADDAYNTARLIPYILGDKKPEHLS